MMPFIVMTASIVIIFLIIIGRGHARPDSTPRRPASAACGCTRQDRGAFAALQGLSSSSIPVFDDIVHVERAASMTLSRRQRAELKRGEGRCSCGLNAVRSQVAADGSCRSLPMAVADRCRWPLPIVAFVRILANEFVFARRWARGTDKVPRGIPVARVVPLAEFQKYLKESQRHGRTGGRG